MTKLSPEERAKDIVSYRIILIFTAALLSILVLFPLMSYADSAGAYVSYFFIGPLKMFYHYPIIKMVMLLVGIIGIVGVIATINQHRSGKAPDQFLFRGPDIIVGAAAFLLCMGYLLLVPSMSLRTILYFAMPVICILGILRYIYQPEFVFSSVYCAFSALFVYLSGYFGHHGRVGLGVLFGLLPLVFAIILVGLCLAFIMLGVRYGGKKILGKKTLFFIPLGLGIVGSVCGLLVMFGVRFIFVEAAYLLIYLAALVFCTTRLSE